MKNILKKTIITTGLLIGIVWYRETSKKLNISLQKLDFSGREEVFYEANGLILFKDKGLFGYIDKANKEVLKPEWDQLEFYSDLGLIKGKKNKQIYLWGKDGKSIFERDQVEDIVPIEKGVFLVTECNKKMKIESTNRAVISKAYDNITYIGDKQYAVTLIDKDNKVKSGVIEIVGNSSKEILPTKYDGIKKLDKKSFFVSEGDKLTLLKELGKGDIKKLEIESPVKYFDEDKLILGHEHKDELRFINDNRSISYDLISGYSYGKAIIANGEKYGVIDDEGKIIIEPKYEFLSIASSDLVIIKSGDKYGYIDLDERTIVSPIYDEVTAFFGNRAMVILDGKLKVIDKKGKVLEGANYDVITEIKDDVVIGGTGYGFGATNMNGKVILETKYDNMVFWGSKYIKAKEGEIEYLYDYNGTELLQFNTKDEYVMYDDQINIGKKVYLFKK